MDILLFFHLLGSCRKRIVVLTIFVSRNFPNFQREEASLLEKCSGCISCFKKICFALAPRPRNSRAPSKQAAAMSAGTMHMSRSPRGHETGLVCYNFVINIRKFVFKIKQPANQPANQGGRPDGWLYPTS